MSRENWDWIEGYKNAIINGNVFVTTVWHRDDIEMQAEEMGEDLSYDEIGWVAEYLINNHDAEFGTNWTVIEDTIRHIISLRKERTGYSPVW